MRRRYFLFFPDFSFTSAKSAPIVWPTAGGTGVAMLTSLGGRSLVRGHAGHISQWKSISSFIDGHQ